jgi:hypothetical protein
MKSAVQSICCQLRTIAEAAAGNQQFYSGLVFNALSASDLRQILATAQEASEALICVIARAEDKERALSEVGYVPPGGAA